MSKVRSFVELQMRSQELANISLFLRDPQMVKLPSDTFAGFKLSALNILFTNKPDDSNANMCNVKMFFDSFPTMEGLGLYGCSNFDSESFGVISHMTRLSRLNIVNAPK